MNWVGIAYIVLVVLTIVLGILMLAYTWPRRGVLGAKPLSMMLFVLIFWSAMVLAEILASSPGSKLVYLNLRQIGLVSLPVLWLLMTIELYEQDDWTRRWLLAGLFAFPALVLFLAYLNHPLVRASVDVTTRFGLTVIAVERGPWNTLEVAYSYTLILIGVFLLLDLTRRSAPGQRYQTVSLIIGIGITVIANFLDVSRLNPIAPLVPIVFAFVPSSLFFMWGLFRQPLLDVLPVAHDRVLEAIADGVMVVNGVGRIVDLNRSAGDILRRALPNQPQPLGKMLVDVMIDWPEWKAASPELRSRFEVPFVKADARIFYEVEVTTLKTLRGDLMGQIMLINDITAHKHAMELQAESERIHVLQQFIRDASHDLRTPMSIIQSSAYLMKRLADKQIGDLATLHPKLPQVYASVIEGAIDLTGKLRDRAVAADDAARRLWSILSGMIELAELEAASAIEKHPMDLNLIVEAVVKGRHAEAERHGVALEHTSDASIPVIFADERHLSRAIDAVILNAIQYTLTGGRISVRTQRAGESVCVEVADTGIGIKPDDLPRIFDRFFRADPSRSTETGGAGLGLSLAKAILEAHGGSISVQSELGAGSTFKLLVPLGA
ncbi:MAG: hypothetical protein IPK52_14340 [Chloroflexi bacterium]|nr:hypothetical protein [Chloroflexota bacterium]